MKTKEEILDIINKYERSIYCTCSHPVFCKRGCQISFFNELGMSQYDMYRILEITPQELRRYLDKKLYGDINCKNVCREQIIGREDVFEKNNLKEEPGKKFDKDKLRMDLIPILPLKKLAEVFTIGAKKYDERNWEKGMLFSRLYGALLRHVTAFWNGESIDPDDGQHHLASVAWCAFALMELEEKKPEFDDRPIQRKDNKK